MLSSAAERIAVEPNQSAGKSLVWFHRGAAAVQRRCSDNAAAVSVAMQWWLQQRCSGGYSWQCSDNAVSGSALAIAVAVQWQCSAGRSGDAVAVQWQCSGGCRAMQWQCKGNAVAMQRWLSWRCSGDALAMQWRQLVTDLPDM